MTQFTFRPFEDSDFEAYESLIRPEMEPEDYISREEYPKLRKLLGLRFWVVIDDSSGRWAAWCAGADSRRRYEQFRHIYGLAVLPDYRGRGLSNRIYEHLIRIYGGHDMTVSIQPSKIQSLNIALKHGFRPFEYHAPYIELIRKAT